MREVDPKSTSRALAFELWMKAPMPMVTLMKPLDVTALVRRSRKRGSKFNMLLCWCIGKAASGMEDFYLLPVGDKLMQYDHLAVNTVVATRDGSIATCDIPVSADLEQFDRDYRKLTGQVRESGESYELGEDYMVIGTSALAKYEIDGAVNIYAGCYNNPFLIWGKPAEAQPGGGERLPLLRRGGGGPAAGHSLLPGSRGGAGPDQGMSGRSLL